jgi:16S rRNA (cytosine1402-N4)-methyltransferase
MGPTGRLLGIDQDEQALARAGRRLAEWKEQCTFAHGNFADIADIAKENGFTEVDGVLMDIGVSSDQLEEAERGFSFMKEGPLDMRMDKSCGETAADLVNNLPEFELRQILRSFGEEPRARRIAQVIVKEREKEPIITTLALAEMVEKAVGGRRGRIHPATRTFQALRIAVNKELDSLKNGLIGALSLLRNGGRIAVISFHSLEDRIVKRFFAAHVGKHVSLIAGGSEWVGELPLMELINRKPVMAENNESELNPRARSAKLRVAKLVVG